MTGFIQKMALSVLFIICANVVSANSASLTSCPSVSSFKVTDFEITAPYGYDAHTGSMKVFVLATYAFDEDQTFDFVMYPVNVKSGGSLVNNVNALITKLQPETNVPFNYHVNDEDGSVSICAYSLPGDANITALLVADDSDSGPDRAISSIEHQTHMRQLFVKQLGLK